MKFVNGEIFDNNTKLQISTCFDSANFKIEDLPIKEIRKNSPF